jgi:hypothetical protein
MKVERRTTPPHWSDQRHRAQVRAAYIAECGPRPDDRSPNQGLAAIVVEMDPLLFPRRLVWKVKRRDGRWPPYVVWGFWWSDYARNAVAMGDDPSDCVRMYDPEAETEEQARGIAKRYLSELGGTNVRDLSFDALPPFVQGVYRWANRRGRVVV